MTEIIEKILDMLKEKNGIKIDEIAKLLPFSEDDIKKVVTMLSESGKITLSEDGIVSLTDHGIDTAKDVVSKLGQFISDESFSKIKGLIDINSDD